MEYMSTSKVAEKWNISRRRVTKLCTEGRIEGAVLISKIWLIPEKAEKPDDLRRMIQKESKDKLGI